MKCKEEIKAFEDVGRDLSMPKFVSLCFDSINEVVKTDILAKVLMANPTFTESSEDKESGDDKQKTVSKPSKEGSEVGKTKDVSYFKCPDDDTLRQSQTLTHQDISYQAVSHTRVENGGNLSTERLPSQDLSMDARACERPQQRKSKADLRKNGKFEKPSTKGSEFNDEKLKKVLGIDNKEIGKTGNREDIENLIKDLVNGPVSDVKFFDAAIVYDKNDYDIVLQFQHELIKMSKSELNETLRIELFDSEEFSQSKIMVVEDVLKKCSVVFVYLTSNFTSGELNLFIEEAIGISRLGLGTEQYGPQNQWVLKPVHTEPRKFRNYKTPVGLLTVNGIDWFDRHSSHTIHNIIGILKAAITQRKQRELEINTSINYNTIVGGSSEMPYLGPPFNKQHRSSTFPQQLVKHHTDPTSFRQGTLPHHPMQMYHTNIRTDAHPSYVPQCQDTPYSNEEGFRLSQHSNILYPPSNETSQLGIAQSLYQMPPPYTSIAKSTGASGRQGGPSTSTVQPGYIPQTEEEQRRRILANQAVGHLPSYPEHVQSIGQFKQMIPAIPQHPIYPPSNIDFQRRSSNGNYPSMCVSQDAFQSQSGNFDTSQTDDTSASSRLGALSEESGNMISGTNLSADDDVEVDNSTSCNGEVTKHSQQHDDFDVVTSDESEESSVESDCSSDSDSDCFEDAKVVEKVVKIYKCKNVQLGEGNVVKEIKRKKKQTDVKMKKQSEIETRNVAETLRNVSSADLPQNVLSKPEMNISVSEENMSVQNAPTGIQSGNRHSTIRGNTSTMCQVLQESRSTTKPKQDGQLKMSVGNKYRDYDMSPRFTNVFSPDDNVTEDQLYASGSLSSNSVSSGTCTSSAEAPFCFSQGIQQSRDFRKLVFPLTVNSDKICEKSCDRKTSMNSEELD